jgi:Barstar (barnase inhibitor)
MPHTKIKLDMRRIHGWGDLHDLFIKAFGFPDSYSRNMNSWMTAMAALDDPAKALSTLHIPPGTLLVLELDSVDEFAERAPKQYEALVECTAIVNWRRMEAGADPILLLAFFKN